VGRSRCVEQSLSDAKTRLDTLSIWRNPAD
jgi:hypothetical protein